MNQKQFTKQLADKSKLSIKTARKLVEAFGGTIETALKKGEKVKYSNFGTFYLVNYPSKVIKHPQFGGHKKLLMLDTNAVKWMPSDNIKDLVGHHIEAETVTSFGSSKRLKAAKKEAGISDRKAEEISDEEQVSIHYSGNKKSEPDIQDEETVEIPIHVSHKSWIDLPVQHPSESGGELAPYNKQLQVQYIDLSKTEIPDTILCLVPEEIARRTKVIPIDIKNEVLVLGMADPKDHDTIKTVRNIVKKKISPRLISESDFAKIFEQYKRLSHANTPVSIKVTDAEEKIAFAKSAPVSRIVNLILKRAVREGASTIHFDPEDGQIFVKFRVNGKLITKTHLDSSLEKPLANRLRTLAKIGKEDTRAARANFSLVLDGSQEYFELLSIPVVNGEKIVVNLVERVKSLKKLTELDLNSSDFMYIADHAATPGLTLVTGSSAVDRQSVFYALADLLSSKGLNIIAIENNPSVIISGINQIDIAEETDLDATLSTVRQLDCDVVMVALPLTTELVGKILSEFDQKTLVATIDAPDSFEALLRANNLGVNSGLLSEQLKMIITTKSVLRICSTCRTVAKTDPKVIREVKDILSSLPGEERSRLRKLGNRFYYGKGCPECNQTGYLDKLTLFEVLKPNDKIRQYIGQDKNVEQIRKEAERNNFINLAQDGVAKTLAGQTTIDEIIK